MSELTKLTPGSAKEFRDTLNDNFSQLVEDTNKINDDLLNFESQINMDLATTGSIEYLTEEEGENKRRFVTQSQIDRWNTNIWIDSSDPENVQIMQGDSTNVTQTVKDIIIDESTVIPTKTSELDNSDGTFLPGPVNSEPVVVSISNVPLGVEPPVEETRQDIPITNEFKYRYTITVPGCTPDMIPVVVFSQSDAEGKFAQITEAANGSVYVWGKSDDIVTTIPYVYAFSELQLINNEEVESETPSKPEIVEPNY